MWVVGHAAGPVRLAEQRLSQGDGRSAKPGASR
jgi:hypothetical protein